jgi:hypothetical protein
MEALMREVTVRLMESEVPCGVTILKSFFNEIPFQ